MEYQKAILTDENLQPQKLFGELVKLAIPVVKYYHSDLYHDAMWCKITAENAQRDDSKVLTFFYGVRETGTTISSDTSLFMSEDIRYRIELWRGSYSWEMRIYNLSEESVDA